MSTTSKYGFTKFTTVKEFENWLNNKSITRSINGIQIHHTWQPSYEQCGKYNSFELQKNMKSYHVKTNGWNDIAQTFSIFPDGIMTGRSINSTPIGIKGWNPGKICIEIVANMDKGKDILTDKHKELIIGCYAVLCKRLKITPSTSTLRCHCWFTAGGTYLGGYNPNKSAKTCPGTNFMGIGNTKSAIENYFIPWVKEYMDTGKCQFSTSNQESTPVQPKPSETTQSGKYIVRYLQRSLNADYGCNLAVDGSYGPKTKAAVKRHLIKRGCKGDHVEWLQAALNNRVKSGLALDGSFGPATYAALKLYQAKRGLTPDGVAGIKTVSTIVND